MTPGDVSGPLQRACKALSKGETIPSTLWIIFIGLLALGGGLGIGFLAGRILTQGTLKQAKDEAVRLVQDARRDIERLQKEASLEAKDRLYQARQAFEQENRERRNELVEQERRLNQREQSLDKKMSTLDRKESDLTRKDREVATREKTLTEKELQLEQATLQQRRQLEAISAMTAEEAKRNLMASMEQEARYDAIKLSKRIEDEAREGAERTAREIIVSSVQRYAHDYVNEATVSVLQLPNDEMKGRIIGREGRNIRALEAATGIDLVIDDTPEAIIISGFDPFRREIAKVSLERLMHDGRIHPARIEEVVDKVRKEIEKLMVEEAEKVMFDLGVQDVHPDLVKLLGKLKYRTSYGQNNLMHAREAAFICGTMAAELGLDVKLAKRAALLHDVGKAVSNEEEGTHPNLGGEYARKFGEHPKVVNAIMAHHGDIEWISPEGVLVAVAEGLSAARPGARREAFESYIKRLEKLEEIATSFKGVDKAYAIRAGREVRVIINQDGVSDAESAQISRDLAKRVESELTYPGQIKITVIRESRYIEYAK
ncbi:MAG: ribonuclease Y [Nitrospiria bacterium]